MAVGPHKNNLTSIFLKGVLLFGSAIVLLPQRAQAQQKSGFAPDGFFVLAGVGEQAQMVAGGAIWPWALQRDWLAGRLTGQWEASVGRWRADKGTGGGSAGFTQWGLAPVLRWQPNGNRNGFFIEGGIGLIWVTPLYRNGDKQFSTRLNFADQLGVGLNFGPGARQELSLRVLHVSNGGLKRPNPGEEFLQLRYVWRY